MPELNGVDIHNKSTCEVTSSASSKTHGTAVASILVSSVYGVAPESSLLTYQIPAPSRGDSASPSCAETQNGLSKVSVPWLLNQAMNDGAQIVNFSASSSLQGDELKWTVARSLTKGVIITAAAGNEATDENSSSLSQWSGVVGVSAIGVDGNRQDYSSWGQGVTTTAVGGPVKTHDFATNQIVEMSGTSFSSPSSPVSSRSPARSGRMRLPTSCSSSSSRRASTRTTPGTSTPDTAVSIRGQCSKRIPRRCPTSTR